MNKQINTNMKTSENKQPPELSQILSPSCGGRPTDS